MTAKSRARAASADAAAEPVDSVPAERVAGAGLVGQDLTPSEYDGYLRGTAKYLADLVEPGDLHAAFVRSVVASARIVSVDVSEAAGMEGVVFVASGAQLAADGLPMRSDSARVDPTFAVFHQWFAPTLHFPAVAVDEVHYVGEPVAIVIATDRYLAEDAAEAVVVDYDERAPVIDALDALLPDSPLVYPELGSNIAASMRYGKGDVAAAQATPGAVTVRREYEVGRQSAVPMEGRGVLARPDGAGGLDVFSSTQFPFILTQTLAQTLACDPASVRVQVPSVGGAFGQKTTAYGEDLAVAFVARQLGRPVAWVEDRYENLTTATQSRDQRHVIELTVDRQGRILALDDEFVVNYGAWSTIRSGVIANTAIHLMGAYKIPAIAVRATGVFSNKAPTAQYRGAGRPEAAYALERVLDAAAREIGVSRRKIREINLLGPDDLPYHQGIPYRDGEEIVFDGRDYVAVARAAWELLDPDELETLRYAAPPGCYLGAGLATFIEATGRGPEPEYVRVRLEPDGTIAVQTAGGPSGQGHQTTLAQIAADAALVDFAGVRVTTGSAVGLPHAGPTAASRTAVIAGSAVHVAVGELVAKVTGLLADHFGAPTVAHTRSGFEAGGETVSWARAAQLCHDAAAGAPIEVVTGWAPPRATWTMGAHVAVVEVDARTGKVRVLRYGVAEESGPAINGRIVNGQVRGGVAQGIGSALLEESGYDASGQPMATSLADYRVPEAAEVPTVRIAHLLEPSKLNPLGIKGVGESGVVAVPAAVASAVEDALAQFHISPARTPLSADHLLKELVRAGVRS